MQVDDAERRDVDDRLRNNLAIADDDHDFGRECAQTFDDFRTPHTLRLIHLDRMAQRGLFHRRGREFLFAAFGTIGLGDDQHYVVTG